MAPKATILKAQLNLSDLDRHIYSTFELTLAQHPSETPQRLMVRLLAYALNAEDDLHFTRGLCVDDEPELWLIKPSGEVDLWIELGLVDEKRLKRACSRANEVRLYCYGSPGAQQIWWQKNAERLAALPNLHIWQLAAEQTQRLAELLQRNMRLEATVQENNVWLGDQHISVHLELLQLQ